MCNPLGTHTKKHKLGIVLFMLGHIPPKHRSTLRAINLIACAVQPVIEKHGLDRILDPFVSDLNTLTHHGVPVEINGVRRTFRGGLLCFLADNLDSNALGGFKFVLFAFVVLVWLQKIHIVNISYLIISIKGLI